MTVNEKGMLRTSSSYNSSAKVRHTYTLFLKIVLFSENKLINILTNKKI